MQPSQRHEEIVSLLRGASEITVEEFAKKLGVSKETIRRDLAHLDSIGHLHKFHGGARSMAAMLATGEKEGPFAQRMVQNIDAKRSIARAASQLFKPGDSLFIDTGSTTVVMAESLAQLSSLTVITNSPRIAATVAVNNTHKVFLLGGAYSADAGESVGPLALDQVGKFRAGHVVLTIGAMDVSCVMDFDLQEAEMAKAMIERADRVTVLADHTKFDRRAVFEVAPLRRIHSVVTDAPPSDQISRSLGAAGVSLIVASRAA